MVTVICRSCGREQRVMAPVRSPWATGGFVPDACDGCAGTDLVALADLSSDELADIERGWAA